MKRLGEQVSVSFWYLADTRQCTANVRFRGQSGHALLHCTCPLLTQSGHHYLRRTCLLSGVKRTLQD